MESNPSIRSTKAQAATATVLAPVLLLGIALGAISGTTQAAPTSDALSSTDCAGDGCPDPVYVCYNINGDERCHYIIQYPGTSGANGAGGADCAGEECPDDVYICYKFDGREECIYIIQWLDASPQGIQNCVDCPQMVCYNILGDKNCIDIPLEAVTPESEGGNDARLIVCEEICPPTVCFYTPVYEDCIIFL